MHVNLLLGTPKTKYEPFITHNRGTLKTFYLIYFSGPGLLLSALKNI